MNYQTVLEQLCSLPGPSGHEGPVAQAAVELLRPLTDEAYLDKMGNAVGVRRCGRENAHKLLLDAHLDEIGFLITGHEAGFLRFAPVGGVDPRMLPDREMTILTQPPITGVVACLPPHVQSPGDADKSLPIKELYIDVGLCQEEAQRRIPIGTPAVYRAGCAPLGEDFLCGKALDDRACFATLLGALEELKGEELDVDLYVMGSVQEEIGGGPGAQSATYRIAPEMCVAVDVTHGVSPGVSKDKAFEMGGGPAIGRGPNCTRWMADRMFRVAKELEMEVQTEVIPRHSGTNGWSMQISREGVATAILSVPLRYMHTPVEVVHRRDLEEAGRLLAAFVRGIGKEVAGHA